MAPPKSTEERAKHVLRLLEKGPLARQEILASQKGAISQPSFSRTVRALQDDILMWGKGRNCRYGRRRPIDGVETPILVFHVQESGDILTVGNLWPIFPEAFVFESKNWAHLNGLYQGMPWFLEHTRPSGFLGRQIPQRHPQISPQRDIRLWTDDTCLKFATHYGDALPGSLICGKPALERMLSFQASSQPRGVLLSERAKAYPELALGQLESAVTSSSAEGEQAKFLTTIVDESRNVLVKFSPTMGTPVGQRIADLLVAERLALETLGQGGLRAARCTTFEYGNRVFLESTRFDRTPTGGRRPVHSLFALAAQYTGLEKGWYETSLALIAQGVIPKSEKRPIATLEAFGHLIANADMHLHNLAFESQECHVTQLAPAFDMLPMLFYPHSHHVAEPAWALDGATLSRLPSEAWMEARPLAETFWHKVATSSFISAGFRGVAQSMKEKVTQLSGLLSRLPSGGDVG